ncbi:hypothetical protein HYW20_03410 [Candidatus Woesearchaeota archaeon]|nr:hypothetical protein [Candidatus Woesearchaeota archaeon]
MPKLTEIPRDDLRKSDSYDLTEKLMNQGHRLFRGEQYTPNLETSNYFLLEPNANPNQGTFKLDYDRLSDMIRSAIGTSDTDSTLPQGLLPAAYGHMIASSEKLLPYLDEIIVMYDSRLIDINGKSGHASNKKLYAQVKALKLLIGRLQNLPIGEAVFQKTFDNLVKFSSYLKESAQVASNTDSQIQTLYSLNLIDRRMLL